MQGAKMRKLMATPAFRFLALAALCGAAIGLSFPDYHLWLLAWVGVCAFFPFFSG